MEFLIELWLPIVLSAVFVFIVSSVLHMVIPIHKGDYSKLADEDAILEAMRSRGVAPNDYVFPCPASMKDMGSPEMLARYKQGPVGFLTVLPNGPPAIGKSLLQWFLFSLAVGALVAYTASLTLDATASYMKVFRVTSVAATLAYGVGHIPDSIWKGTKWSTTIKFIFDGVLYGLVTAGAFAWLWPAAT